jgi:hypothetical protein
MASTPLKHSGPPPLPASCCVSWAPLQDVVERSPYPPQSIILLGRSGTGKTTCAVGVDVGARWQRRQMKGGSMRC